MVCKSSKNYSAACRNLVNAEISFVEWFMAEMNMFFSKVTIILLVLSLLVACGDKDERKAM